MTSEQELERIEKRIAERKPLLDEARNQRKKKRGEPLPLSAARAIPAGPQHTLVAQGDSWFHYPGLGRSNLIDFLRANHNIDDPLGANGLTLNDIAYHDDRKTELIYEIGRVQPQGVLLSGGGDDIVVGGKASDGNAFYPVINDRLSGLPNPNLQSVSGVVATLQKAFLDIANLISTKAVSMGSYGTTPLHLFIHGYDYIVPDGRGAFVFWGPWFDHTFTQKGYPYNSGSSTAAQDLRTRFDIVEKLLNEFNSMLSSLPAVNYPCVRIHYIKLLGTLKGLRGPDYTDDWANELHPTPAGFAQLAQVYNTVLVNAIGGGQALSSGARPPGPPNTGM
jgi:hypothetical protein